jgi:outer membrane protein insertion porin family
VQNIFVFGNQVVDESLIRARLSVQEGKEYHPAILQEKVAESIRALYSSSLFGDVEVEVEYAQSGNGINFYIKVSEKPTLLEVLFEGEDELAELELKEQIQLLEGQVFGPADIERNRQRLIQHYRTEGYLLVDITYSTEVDSETGKTRVLYSILEGQKVEVAKIEVEGNRLLDSEGIIGSMASEISHWFNDGEYKEDVFKADKDSVLKYCRSFGYIDAQVLETRTEYIPDPTYHFYNGQFTKDFASNQQLLKTLNRDLRNIGHPFTELAVKATRQSNPYYRRFRQNNDQSVLVREVTSEVQAVELFNRYLDLENLRQQIISRVTVTSFKSSEIKKMLKQDKLNEDEERKLVRLMLEEYYPVLKYREINTSSKVRLVVKVEEGRKYYMGNAVFLGNEVLVDDVLRSIVSLDSGDVFNDSYYQEMKQSFFNVYREDGYLFVRVEDTKDYQDSIINVTFNIVEGKPAHVRLVQVNGNTTTKDKVVRREIKLFPGDTYRQSSMERSFRDIMQLNYFDNVVPDVKMVGGQAVDLVFDVQEREAGTGQFTAGMAYSGAQGMVGTLGLSIPNCCLGDGQKADLNIQYGAQKQDYSIGFSEPWFMDKPIRLGGSINYSWAEYDGWDEPVTRTGFRVFTGTRLTWPDDYFYIQGDYSFQYNLQGENDPGVVLRTGIESAIGATIIRDDKNLPIFPTEGSRVSLNVQRALPSGVESLTESLGINRQYFEFWQTDLNMKWWFPLIGKLSVSLDNRIGIITGEKIQYRTLYRMGGLLGYQGKLRGYGNGQIGAGKLGRSYYNFTSELIYPVAEQRFYLQGFFDAGNVYGDFYDTALAPDAANLRNPGEDVDLTNVYGDIGVGFRIIIPMLGIIGFDWAWPLDADKFNREYKNRATNDGGVHMNFVIEQGF